MERVMSGTQPRHDAVGPPADEVASRQIDGTECRRERGAHLVRDGSQQLGSLLYGLRCYGVTLADFHLEVLTVGQSVDDHHFEQKLVSMADAARLFSGSKPLEGLVKGLHVESNDLFGTDAVMNKVLADEGRFVQRLLARALQIFGEHLTIPIERDRGIHCESSPVSTPWPGSSRELSIADDDAISVVADALCVSRKSAIFCMLGDCDRAPRGPTAQACLLRQPEERRRA